MQAGAPDLLLFDERHGQVEVVGVERGGVPARSPTDDRYVVHTCSDSPTNEGSQRGAELHLCQTPTDTALAAPLGTLPGAVQTRFLLVAAAVTALVILGASAVWLVVTFG